MQAMTMSFNAKTGQAPLGRGLRLALAPLRLKLLTPLAAALLLAGCATALPPAVQNAGVPVP
uniref:hypothetical protein n=1 Tax=Comamonas sp. B-9 TaxID=1055192 RepID=UPI0019553DED